MKSMSVPGNHSSSARLLLVSKPSFLDFHFSTCHTVSGHMSCQCVLGVFSHLTVHFRVIIWWTSISCYRLQVELPVPRWESSILALTLFFTEIVLVASTAVGVWITWQLVFRRYRKVSGFKDSIRTRVRALDWKPTLHNNSIADSMRESSMILPRNFQKWDIKTPNNTCCCTDVFVTALIAPVTSWSKPRSAWREQWERPQAEGMNNALFTAYKGTPVFCANQNGAGNKCHSRVLLQVVRAN